MSALLLENVSAAPGRACSTKNCLSQRGALNATMHVPFLALAEQEEIENASATCVRKLGWGVQEAFEAKHLHSVRWPPQVVSPQRQWGKGSFAQGLPITSHTLDHTRIYASEAKLVKQNQWEPAATWTPKGHINGAGDPTPLRQKALKPSFLRNNL